MALSEDLISQFVRITNDNVSKSSESTHYGTVVRDEESGTIWLQLDGSDEYTPITTTADYIAGERVIVRIKDHTATIIGNLSSPAARTEDVKEAGNKITVVENLVADKVSSDELSVERARIDDLVTETATIRDLLSADNAEIGNLVSDNVEIKQQLSANKASIDNLSANKLDATVASATYATIENLEVTNEKVYNLEATYGDFERLTAEKFTAVDAEFEQLDGKYATIEELDVERGRIDELESTMLTADHAVIKDLEADVAYIDTMMFGSASGDVIQSSFANAVIAQLGNAQIKSAMIDSISASKITSGDVITNNVRVRSEDGSLIISDETMQISDSNRVRVQIGKDAANDYSINIWDQNGNLMFSKGGITDSAIKDAIIRNDMVSDTANIAAHKLDIDSLFEEINGSTKTIKSTQIYFDDEKQTLDVAFKSLGTEVTRLGTSTTSQGTQISAIQGQIASKVWQQDIDTAKDSMSTQYSILEQKVDGVSATVASHTTQINNKADSSTVITVNNRVTELEANLSGFKSTVGTTYATKTELGEIHIGGRNLLRDSRRILLLSNNSSIYPTSCIKMVENDIEFNRVQRTDCADYPTPSLSLFSGIPISQFNYHEMTGKQVTLSFKARTSQDITGRFMSNTYGGPSTINFDMPAELFTTEWKTFYIVVDEFPDLSEYTGIRFNPYLFQLTEDNIEEFYLDVRDYKFELGNKPTDWTPAPEDVQSDIELAQSVANAAQEAANQNAAEMAAIVTNFNAEMAGLQTQIDGSITTWFYEYEPTNTNKPAIDWITVDQKNVHLGDLCYDTITGYCYRWQVQNNSYSWQRLTDTDVTKALADAQTAKDTADQKRRVFYIQPSPPYDKGDLWVQGSGGDILRCQTDKITGQSYSESDWVPASKYTDDTLANTANTNALAAQSTATQAKSDIDGLTIGGRNLVLNSAPEKNANNYHLGNFNVSSPLVSGVTYTISMDVTPAENLEYIAPYLSNGWAAQCHLYVSGTDRQTISCTFTAKYVQGRTPEDDPSHANIDLYRFPNDGSITTDTTIHWIKIEQGNRATDWTPAPEDAEMKISALNEQYTTLNQTVDSISATVASNSTAITKKADQSTVTEVSNKLTKVEADLSGYKTTVSDTYISKTDVGAVNLVNEQLVGATATGEWEHVGDGWLHYRYDNTAGTTAVYGTYRFILSDYVSHLAPNTAMTVMVEMRDLGSTDGVYAYSYPENAEGVNHIQVAGTTYVYAVNARNGISVSRNMAAYVMPESADGKAKTALGGWLVAVPAGATADVLLRQGIYEGEYRGHYVAPVGDIRSLIDRVGSAETSITQNSNSITSLANRTETVENKFGNYSTTAEMNSAIEQKANSITSAVSATYSTKNETSAVVNGIQVGGRNLLLDSGTERSVSRNYDHTVAPIDLHSGDIYTYSVWLKASENTTVRVYLNDDSGQTRTGVYFADAADVTTEYQYFVFPGRPTNTSSIDFTADNMIRMRVYAPEGITLTGKLAKLELGNKATDWTPAPEDMATADDAQLAQTTAEAAQETASNAETLIQQLSHSISMLVTDGNGTSLMTQTDDGWTFSTAEIQANVADVAESLDTLTNELGSTSNAVGVLEQAVADLGEIAEYVKIGTYDDEPCIELGEGDSEFKMRITNTRILFMEGSNVVAHISNQSLHIRKAVIEEELQQGGFVWKVRSNGNMGLVWKGVSS